MGEPGGGAAAGLVGGGSAEGMLTLAGCPLDRLAAALARAQAGFKTIAKTRVARVESRREGARGYTYTYADLGDIIEAVRGALTAEDLAFTQQMVPDGQQLLLRTVLLHGSGQWLESSVPLDTRCSPQEFGSQLTYFRRYSLCGILGVVAEDDDDGSAAEAAAVGNGSRAQAPAATAAGRQRKPAAGGGAGQQDMPVGMLELRSAMVAAAGGDEKKALRGMQRLAQFTNDKGETVTPGSWEQLASSPKWLAKTRRAFEEYMAAKRQGQPAATRTSDT